MCFILLKKDTRRAIKAKKDITVYKIIYKNNYPVYGRLYIKNKRCKWEKGMWYTETDFPKRTLSRTVSRNGFHSFKDKDIANFQLYWYMNCKISIFIIPKGAYYYENNTQYYSSDIIYLKDLK